MNAIVETINAAGRAFVDFAVPMLTQSGVLILFLFLVDAVLRRRVRAVFRYWIWMLVLVKLVLPPSLGSPVSVGTWFGDELEAPTISLLAPSQPQLADQASPPLPSVAARIVSQPVPAFVGSPVPDEEGTLTAPPAAATEAVESAAVVDRQMPAVATPTAALNWQGFVVLAWAAVVLTLLLLLLQRALFVRGLVAQAEKASASMQSALDGCRARIGLRRPVALGVSPNASSPAVCGLWRPVILIPRTLAPKLSGRDLQAVLLHELAHIKRGDLWVNLAQTLLQIVYFYHPLLWLANMMVRRVREQAVDEAVLVAMGETAGGYPDTLVNVAKLAFRRRPALSLRLVGVVESKSALTGRIKHILNRPLPKSTRLGLLGLLVISIVAAVMLPMAQARPMTDRARKVMALAREEARRFNHSYIGTEHILIALARDSDAVSAKALAALDVDVDTLRAEMSKLVRAGSELSPSGRLPRTPRATNVLKYARQEAKTLGHDYVGTEHMLLGLTQESNSIAVQVLANLDLTPRQIRTEILKLVQSQDAHAPKSQRTDLADADGDGLSDFQERHKYLTDPDKRDSDGDGTPDGDWAERREYTYSIRTVLRFMPPLDEAALCDDFQDARVLNQTDDYIEIEVIHYPLATVYESIGENRNWREDYAHLTEYLAPGATTNWDEPMRQALLAELKADGIDVHALSDKQVVEQVSRWLLKKSRYLGKVFTTFYVHCPNGRPEVYPGLEEAFKGEFERDEDNYDWTLEDHFDHEVLGKGMFYNKTHGSCTSTAVYLTTVLRALGIPTRMVLVSPAVDASNREQILMVKHGLTHHQVRETVLAGLRGSSHGFTNHTLNEVYVGNRWVRLDYNTLGPAVYGVHRFGLQTHLYTINDLSDVDLASTWGWRYAKGERSDTFGHSNPYSAVSVSDLFGAHSEVPNPPFAAEDLASSPLPDIFVLHPRAVNVWVSVLAIVENGTYNKTGRPHEREFYENIFEGLWTRKPGDVLLLVFSLDTEDRVPEGYEFVLPQPWPQIESRLKQGETVELGGDARDMKVILLAAPTRGQVIPLIQNSKLLAALKPSSATKEATPAPEDLGSSLPGLVVTFAGGVTVRLLGVCEHPSAGKPWWGPDGTPLETAPYETTGSRLTHEQGYADYEFAAQVLGPGDLSVRWKVPGGNRGSSTGQALGSNGDRLAHTYAYTSNQRPDAKVASVSIGVAAGQWQTRAVHKTPDNEGSYTLDGNYAIAFGIAYEKDGDVHVPVTTNIKRNAAASRVVAIDVEGNLHAGGMSGRGGNVLRSTTRVFDLTLDRIKEFRFEMRPYDWVEFRNVSLRLGEKTDVKVNFQPMTDRGAGGGAPAERETAPEEPAVGSRRACAELPNGVTVELLGACEHPSAGRQWWRPDGSPLEDAPYDRPGAEVTPGDRSKDPFELALRVRGLPENWEASVRSVDNNYSGAADPPYKGGRRLHDLRWLMIEVDPDQTTCTIRCDIVAPWQTTVRISPGSDVPQQVTGGDVAFTEINEGIGLGVSVTVAGPVGDRDETLLYGGIELKRIIAVTEDGRIEDTLPAVSGSDTGVERATAYFPRLSLADVKEFQYQVRLLTWVEFRNVPLRRSLETDLQISIGSTADKGTGGGALVEPANVASPLELRIAPIRDELAPGVVEQCRRALVQGQTPVGGRYCWVAVRPNTDLGPDLVVQAHAGRTWLLVHNEKRHIVVPAQGWRLVHVGRSTDERGRSILVLRFDDAGADKIFGLTERNNGRALAVIVDGLVVYAPMIGEGHSRRSAVIKGRFSDRELEGMIAVLRGSMSEEAARVNLDFRPVTLRNGVTVELLGVCEHPSVGKQWWRPDGSPLAESPYDDDYGRAFPTEGEKGYKFAVKYSGLRGRELEARMESASDKTTNGGALSSTSKKNGKENTKYVNGLLDEIIVWQGAAFDEELDSCNLEIGVCWGPWEGRYWRAKDDPTEAVTWCVFEDVSLRPRRRSDLNRGSGAGAPVEVPPADPQPGASGVVAELPNGVTVELVAYSQLTQEGLKWWTPDSRPTTIPGIYEADVEGHGCLLAVRIKPEPEAGVSAWFFQPPDVRYALKPVWRLTHSNIWLISLGEGRSYANVELRAQVRDPVVAGTVTVNPAASTRASEITDCNVVIKEVEGIDPGATAFTTHGTAFGLGSPGPGVVAALDTAGRVHPIRRVPRGMLEEMGAGMYGMDGSARYRVDVPPDRFAGIVIEGYSERAGGVKFRNLSLRPGQPTQVRVVVETEERGPWWHPSGYASNLEHLGRILSEYADKHGGRYPGDLRALRDYFDDTRWMWLQEHAVYLGAGKSSADAAPLAYEKTLLRFGLGTYVLYPDKRVDFNTPAELQQLGLPAGRQAGEAASVGSTTLRVPQDFDTIQQAVDAADDGDVIVVERGAYFGAGQSDIEFRGKNVTVRGVPKPFPYQQRSGPDANAVGEGPGPLGRHALAFDGVDDCLIVPPSASLALKPPFCIEVWFKPDFSDPRLKDLPFMSLIRKGQKVSDPPKIKHYQTGGFVALVHLPGEPGARCSGILCTARQDGEVAQSGVFGGRHNPLPLSRPGWMHMFIPYSGKTYMPSPGGEIAIGENIAPFGVPFKGEIAEIRVWNYCLNDEEIRGYGLRSLRGDEPGLVGCWTFEEGDGQIVRDISPSGNHARLGTSTDADAADPMWVNLEAAGSVRGRVSGRVLGPDGTPVAGAQVALCTAEIGVVVRDGRLDQPRTSDMEKGQIVETDAEGRFRFESEPNDGFSLVAAHDAGFAQVGADEFTATREIRLELWGRVEGQVAEGRRALEDQIWMGGLPNETWLKHRRRFRYEARCDAEGRFTFSKVPAGWFEVGYLTEVGDFTSSFTSRTPVVVKSGQTATVRLGGEGRPVIGRFVPPPDYDGPLYFGAGTRALVTTRPQEPRPDHYDQMTQREQQQWRRQWRDTAQAKAFYDAVWRNPRWRHYCFRIGDDGTFRIEDVIPGKYSMTVWLEERPTGQGRPEEIGSCDRTVEVPEIPGGRTDEPLDLGELTLKMRHPLHAGDVAPLFEAEALDGRDIRLADYRGRFVLLILWAPMFHPDLDRLKELYADYEDTGRLRIIGLGGTDTLDEVKSYVEEHEIPWPQVYLGPDWNSELLAKLGGQLQALLIDPEGKIVATWLRGEQLTNTVREALGKAD